MSYESLNYTVQTLGSDNNWITRTVITAEFVDDDLIDYLLVRARRFIQGQTRRVRVIAPDETLLIELVGADYAVPVNIVSNPLGQLQEFYEFTDAEMKEFITAYKKRS